MRTAAKAMAVLTVLVYGCTRQGDAGPPPAPPPPADAPAANCTTVGNIIPYDGLPDPRRETIVVARCSLVRRYATVTRGDWNYSWYVFGFDVASAERGAWPAKQVVFVAYDAWPTLESGIMVDKAPFPYAVGRVMAFYVRTETSPPLVVGQEWRSRVAPHGVPRVFRFDATDAEGERVHDRVWKAVQNFASAQGWPQPSGASNYEQTDDAYVLEVIFGTGAESVRRALRVDRESFRVSELP